MFQEKGIYSVNRNFDYYSIERKSFCDFWVCIKYDLDGDKDHRPCFSEKNDFTLNESYSSENDSSSFVSKEDSSLDKDK